MRRLGLLLMEFVGAAIVLAAVGLYLASEYVDTEDFRQQFTSIVSDLTGQEVVLGGELNIALYPALSLEVHDLALMERPEAGTDPLVRFDDLLVSVRLLPLASHQLEIRTIVVNGMELNLSRQAEGEYNWRPLPPLDRSGEAESASAFFDSVALDGLEVNKATVTFADDVSGQRLQLSGIDLKTGAITGDDDVAFSAESHFSWKNGGVESTLTLNGLVARSDGNLVLKDASAYGSFGGPFLPEGAEPAEVAANVQVDLEKRVVELEKFRLHFLGLSGEGSVVTGDLGQGVSGHGQLTIRPFKPVTMVKRYFPDVPVGSVNGLKEGAFTSLVRFDENGVSLKDMAAVLDDMTVRGDIELKNFSQPQFTFDLRSDLVDLDRYLPLFRTDTPFVWGDYPLDAFRAFRGSGRIRADAFKLLGTVINDIRLDVAADGTTIRADAGAVRKGQGSLGGNARFTLGREGQVPTLGIEADLAAESLLSGFEFLHFKRGGLTGPGSVKLSVRVPSMPCPEQERSINILRRAVVDGSLELGKGKGTWKTEDKTLSQSYASAGVSLKIKPAKSSKAGFFGLDVDAAVHGKGGAPMENFMVTASGPLLLDVDGERVKSAGMDVRTQLAGKLVTRAPDRMTALGRVSFDSVAKTFGAEDVEVRALETLAKGAVRADGSGKRLKAAGKLEVPQADARRIIHLLTGRKLDLADPAALMQVSLSTDFVVSETGFTLSDVRGVLDGMPVSGLVVGQGLVDPVLSVSLDAGKFDLDRYLPRRNKPSLEEIRAGKEPEKAPPAELPLDFLRALRINGKATFDEFKLARIRTTGLTGTVKAEKGDIRVAGLHGRIYGGTLNGDLSAEVGERGMSTRTKLDVAKMQASPLMVDLAEREYVRGETDVILDLMSEGATDDDILANLEGVCQAHIRKGSFKFTGFDVKPTEIKNDGTRDTAATDPRLRRTAFDNVLATFAVKKGVFDVQEFKLESVLLNSTGKGWFNLPDNRIDLSIQNDFVAVPSVTLNIKGRLTDPEVSIPKGRILKDTVSNILSLPQKPYKFLRDLFR